MDLLQTVRKEGSRGGRADFKWEDVQQDAHRESYLGHSLMAPVGRWQKGRDLNWYAKGDDGQSEADKRAEEIRKIKQAEEAARRVALGLPEIENANLVPIGSREEKDKVIPVPKEAQQDRRDKKKHRHHSTKDESRHDSHKHRHRHRDRDHERSRSRSRDRDQHRRRRDNRSRSPYRRNESDKGHSHSKRSSRGKSRSPISSERRRRVRSPRRRSKSPN